MSSPGDACIRCNTPLIDEGDTIRCQRCGFTAFKGGSIINSGGRFKEKTLVCPHCGGMASENEFEEFQPKDSYTSMPIGPAADVDLEKKLLSEKFENIENLGIDFSPVIDDFLKTMIELKPYNLEAWRIPQ